jgi:hypothetical protein
MLFAGDEITVLDNEISRTIKFEMSLKKKSKLKLNAKCKCNKGVYFMFQSSID